jgi:AcrR family transcriptional regulator
MAMTEWSGIRIVEEADKLFGSLGFIQTRLSDIARNAQVPESAIFMMFESKEALLAQVIRCRVLGTTNPAKVSLEDSQRLDPHTLQARVTDEMITIVLRERGRLP